MQNPRGFCDTKDYLELLCAIVTPIWKTKTKKFKSLILTSDSKNWQQVKFTSQVNPLRLDPTYKFEVGLIGRLAINFGTVVNQFF